MGAFCNQFRVEQCQVRAHGAKNFISDTAHIKQGIMNVKEALKVCQARSVQLNKFSDARTFSLPASVLAVLLKLMMKTDKLSAQVLLEYRGAEELKRIYDAVIITAGQLNVGIPNLLSMKDEVVKAEEYLV